jgi:DnaJ-class molecular chaperone
MGHAPDVFASLPGDLLLTVKVKEHAHFKRDAKNISSEIPITLLEAIQGATITVNTVYGPVTFDSPPGVCSGDTKVLKHYGVPEFNPPENYDHFDFKGDHIVRFKVILPEFNPKGDSK